MAKLWIVFTIWIALGEFFHSVQSSENTEDNSAAFYQRLTRERQHELQQLRSEFREALDGTKRDFDTKYSDLLRKYKASQDETNAITYNLHIIVSRQESEISSLKSDRIRLVPQKGDLTARATHRADSDVEMSSKMEPNNETRSAFSTYLSSEERHMSHRTTIRFGGVETNVGEHYNLTSGIYTAPVNGVYVFTFFIEAWYDTESRAALVVDGELKSSSIVHTTQARGMTGGNAVALHLNANQQVWIENSNDNGNYWGSIWERMTTFTGYLLYEL